MLRIFISFFAGVALTLYMLIPGGIQPRDILNPDKCSQLADFDRPAEKVEQAGEMAVFYAAKAKAYVGKTIIENY